MRHFPNPVRRILGTATVAAGLLGASSAMSLPAWSYHWSNTDSQKSCMARAWDAVSRYEYSTVRPFEIDHTTDSVIELEFHDDDVVATLLCTPRTFVLYVFGSQYEITQEVRDDLGDLFEGQ